MEAKDVSEAEDRAEDPGSKNKGQPDAVQPDFPPGGQTPGPTALWEMLERKFLEYQQLASRSPAEQQKNLLNLLPLFLKVGILIFETVKRWYSTLETLLGWLEAGVGGFNIITSGLRLVA